MIKDSENGIVVKIKVVPNSSRNELIREGDVLRLKLTAQPIENRANKALVEYLSKLFKIPKSNIEIIRGESSREKTVLFSTNDEDKKSFIISQLTK